MKITKSSSLKIARWNHLLILTGLIALLCCAFPAHVFAGWALPWDASEYQEQAAEAQSAEMDSIYRTSVAQDQARNSRNLSLALCILCAGVIVYHLKNRTVVKKVIKNEIIQKVVRQEVVVRTPAQDLVADRLVIDGLNVIYGCSGKKPALTHLLGLLIELTHRNCSFKCFFDANTYYTLQTAGQIDDAYAYRRLCRDFPDMFIEVPGGNQADAFILDYAHAHGTPIISNDRYRDYEETYTWLKPESQRRISLLIHSGIVQIIPLGIQAAVLKDINMADSMLRTGFAKLANNIANVN